MHYNGKVHSLKGLTQPELPIKSEKMLQIKVIHNSASYKILSGRSCQSPPRVELEGLEKLPRFNYNVLKWDSAFT